MVLLKSVQKRYTYFRMQAWNLIDVILRGQKKCHDFSPNSAFFQTSEDLKPKDLSKLARKIRADNMKIIAIEQLEMDDTDIDIIAANCRDKTYEFNFEILKKWKNISPENNHLVIVIQN